MSLSYNVHNSGCNVLLLILTRQDSTKLKPVMYGIKQFTWYVINK
jgi:hypothetical protein